MYAAGLSATGLVRNHNEDIIFYTTDKIGPLPNLFIVADGMGGHNAGEVASAKSLEFACDFIRNVQPMASATIHDILDVLTAAALSANNAVYEYSVSDPALYGMGTTFSACSIVDNTLVAAHIGDSRIYAIGGGDITQITTDHTYVEEMVQAGNLTPNQAKTHPRRNVITRVLGCEPNISADGIHHHLMGVDSVLLCSDGLTDMLSDDAIMKLLSQDAPTKDRAQALIDAANKQGGIDNISAIIIDVKGEAH